MACLRAGLDFEFYHQRFRFRGRGLYNLRVWADVMSDPCTPARRVSALSEWSHVLNGRQVSPRCINCAFANKILRCGSGAYADVRFAIIALARCKSARQIIIALNARFR